jgi:hypothetical protein
MGDAISSPSSNTTECTGGKIDWLTLHLRGQQQMISNFAMKKRVHFLRACQIIKERVTGIKFSNNLFKDVNSYISIRK